MKINELNLIDQVRNREIPVLIYLPEEMKENLQIVIFNPGYQSHADLQKPETILAYRKWEYLARHFTNKNYVFIAIQHDLYHFPDLIILPSLWATPTIVRLAKNSFVELKNGNGIINLYNQSFILQVEKPCFRILLIKF